MNISVAQYGLGVNFAEKLSCRLFRRILSALKCWSNFMSENRIVYGNLSVNLYRALLP